MPDRRTFLLATGTMIAGSSATSFAANEKIRIGIVGSGGRARHLLKALVTLPEATVTHYSDVWDGALAETGKLLPNAKANKEQQAIYDNEEIDAVLIASPDHWHVPMTISACEAGKDVYVEKPLTHEPGEAKKLLETVAKTQRVVQVGMQQRSMPHIAEAKTIIDAGTLGTILKVTMSWNRNSNRATRKTYGIKPESVNWKAFLGTAKEQPFDDYKMRNWRFFWDFGGGLFTDLMVHWIDVAHWLTGVDKPSRAVSIGQWVSAKDAWETPDTVQTLLTYPKNIQMHYEGTFSNATRGAHLSVQGTEATIYIDRGAMILTPEKNRKLEAKSLILGKSPTTRGADFYDEPDGEKLHLKNWLDCVKSRKEPNAPVSAGVSAANAAHLANAALRGSGVADASK